MQRSLQLLAASAALSWVGAGASPHGLAATRRAVAQIPGYDFAGCYTEATTMRALTGSSYFDDLLTVEKCANACSGYKHFGVEYGKECYCGNTINDGSVEADLADCSFVCPGDSSENCGAGNRLNLYTRTTDPAVPTLTTYSSRGCYVEPSNARALAGQATGAADMTVEKCATFCGNAGYTLFGLEYYTECYCANVLTPGAVAADAADCKFPCAGNSAELCGGDWRLNLYEFSVDSTPVSTSTTASSSAVATAGPAAYTAEGCYTEAQGVRALSEVSYFDDKMTVEKCAAACAGYTWFGVEYGRECYGGNTIHSAEGSVPTVLSECSFPCPGDPTQKCGAGDRLNVYRFLPAVTPSPTSTSSVISTDTPTSTATDAPSSTDDACDPDDDDDDDDDDASSTVSTAEPTVSTTSASDSSTSATDPATTSSSADPTSTSTSAVDEVTTSTTTSSSAAATTSSPPPIVNIISNGDFEGSGGWTIKNNAVGALTYNFADTTDPHGGLNAASVAYKAGSSAYQAWFNQPITLAANTRYNFEGWVKASSANPGCSTYFYIGSADATLVVKSIGITTSVNIKTTWTQATGFYDSTSAGQYTFNVRWTCSGAAARTYYVDDLSLVAVSA